MLKNIKKVTMLLLIATAMMAVSCTKDDDDYKSSISDDSSYYVKYEVTYWHGYGTYYKTLNYLTPEGMMQSWVRDHDGEVYVWSACAGPFSKGDRAYISIDDPAGSAYWSMSISVKKGEAPFVVKKSVINAEECEYIIE